MTSHHDPHAAAHQIVGDAAYEFLIEYFIVGIRSISGRPHVPTAEELAEFLQPYLEYITLQAKEEVILFTLSEEAQRKGRALFLRDLLKEMQRLKLEAQQRILDEQQKRKFDRPKLPEST
jgi:predicted urease superfamily metal-dependent hydrolase